MRSLSTLLFAILIAAGRSTSWALVNIPLTKLERTGSYFQGSLHADRDRASSLKGRPTSGPRTIPASNLAYTQYTTSVGVGSPAAYYNLVVDTGSSKTFVGSYVRTSTSVPTGQDVNVSYWTGFFSGSEYYDTVTLAADFVITNQSIGDALQYADFGGVDGIIGVGPVDLTQGTLSPDANALIPTVMNNALKQGLIKKQTLGVLFAPATTYNDTNGVLTYGGIDHALYTGEITYTPVTKILPAAQFWGINVTCLTYGTHTFIPQSTAGIVDTGTTAVLLADDFFAMYLDATPGAYLGANNTGFIVILSSSVADIQPLNFTIGGCVFSMDTAAQLIPLDQNAMFGGETGLQYGVIATRGADSGRGLDFAIGQKFMERYYVVFDADDHRVGFAYTDHTFSTYLP
ncbi:acid protease [Suillus subalutaceus]|uniref:acid protease n=1 Tax=Suillus subalutaceus TaxID=48586 RepID=UPI001B868D8A|nr:acid protease [Suillus subalutaceus]KAG1845898.1 acid protease [Suillus subalutaceus]